jgi:hypothetical protein
VPLSAQGFNLTVRRRRRWPGDQGGAAELRRYAEMLQPTPRERLTIAQSRERMSIDPVLDTPVEPDVSLMADPNESK